MTERTSTNAIARAVQHPRRAPRRTVLALVIGVMALWPAAASAAPVNRASDHAALNAYHAYLQDLVSIIPSWRQAENGYIASISGKCGGVLDPLKHAPAGSFNKQAVLAFGFETGADIDAVVYPSARPALGRLAGALAPLHWSSAGIRDVLNSYIGAERRLFAVGPSSLCADAHALENSHGQRVTRGTAAFVVKFAHRVTAAEKDATAFMNVLTRYATPSEHGLISSTNHLLHEFTSRVRAQVVPAAKKLVGTLGL